MPSIGDVPGAGVSGASGVWGASGISGAGSAGSGVNAGAGAGLYDWLSGVGSMGAVQPLRIVAVPIRRARPCNGERKRRLASMELTIAVGADWVWRGFAKESNNCAWIVGVVARLGGVEVKTGSKSPVFIEWHCQPRSFGGGQIQLIP